jgi:hypothetical protein
VTSAVTAKALHSFRGDEEVHSLGEWDVDPELENERHLTDATGLSAAAV